LNNGRNVGMSAPPAGTLTMQFICMFFFSVVNFFYFFSYLQKYYETDLIGRLSQDHHGVVRVLVPLCGKSNDMKWLFSTEIF
jgi:hypothetical protein